MKYQLILISLFLRSSLQIIKSGPSKIPCPNSCECFIAEPGFLYSGGLAVSCKPDKNNSIPEIHPTVTYLDLSGWNIPTLDANTFRATESIEILILKESHIKRIENGTFSGMENLTCLNLYGNELKTISVDAFANMHTKLMTIDLGHNPWNCDCVLWRNLKSMKEVMSLNWSGVVCETEEVNRYRSRYKEVNISEIWACDGFGDRWVVVIVLLLFLAIVILMHCRIYFSIFDGKLKTVMALLSLLCLAPVILVCCCPCLCLYTAYKNSPRDPASQGDFDSNRVTVRLRIRRLFDRFKTNKISSQQIVNDPSNQSRTDRGKMLHRIREIIRQVKDRSDAKSFKKTFCNQVILSEHCPKDDPSYHYFKFIQLLRKEHSDEELKKFADQLYEEIDDEDFKEIIGVLVLKFWVLAYGIVKDKLYSQNSRNTQEQLNQGLPENDPIVTTSNDDINSIKSLSTDPQQAVEKGKKDKAKICCGLVPVTKSGESEKLTLLDQLMAALKEVFNPHGCLREYQKACCSCLPLYFIQNVVAVFFGRCFKNSKKCRNCYRATKRLHKLCCGLGLCLYAIVVTVILASGSVSLILRLSQSEK